MTASFLMRQTYGIVGTPTGPTHTCQALGTSQGFGGNATCQFDASASTPTTGLTYQWVFDSPYLGSPVTVTNTTPTYNLMVTCGRANTAIPLTVTLTVTLASVTASRSDKTYIIDSPS